MEASWDLPGCQAPHDFAVVAAPMRYAGADRPLAVVVAESRADGGGALKKFVLLPGGAALPANASAPHAPPAPRRPRGQCHGGECGGREFRGSEPRARRDGARLSL